jgi:F-type H+-transporting ATPase subunit b
MEETLRQLGSLVLGAIPTIILFLILFVAYRTLVHVPLGRVLAERRRRTEGALEQARADMAAAEGRTAEYERNLRAARAGIFKAQATRRVQALQARATAVSQARATADAQVKQAKAALAQDVAESKIVLQSEAERLASEIIGSILRQVGSARNPLAHPAKRDKTGIAGDPGAGGGQ